jgi:hypothetical protein
MSCLSLAAALAANNFEVEVAEIGKVAVLTISDAAQSSAISSAVQRRREIVRLAREHGFTNVCIELAETNAIVSRP